MVWMQRIDEVIFGNIAQPADATNIARVIEAGIHEGAPFMVVEYIPGLDVRRLLKRAVADRAMVMLYEPVTELEGGHFAAVRVQPMTFGWSKASLWSASSSCAPRTKP